METPGALATVTDVEIGKKLETAKVRISVLPAEKANATLAIFNAARGRLQSLIMKKIQIKPFPKLEFVIDHGFEYAAHVEKVSIEAQNK